MAENRLPFRALEDLQHFGVKLGLKRIHALLALLNNPHLSAPFIHVAGTNGKGSVSAIIASILERAGLKVGLYTSPHLISPVERIRINGTPLSGTQFSSALSHVLEVKKREFQESPTYFEVLTAMALHVFHQEKADCAVLETGMGGRLDATNVVPAGIQVITTISPEHQVFLGKKVDDILIEKLGILKAGSTVILGLQGRLLDQALRRCNRLGCHTVVMGRDLSWKVLERGDWGQTVDLRGENTSLSAVRIPLLGTHQAFNAALALGAAEACGKYFAPVLPENIRAGIECVSWPGRFQRVNLGEKACILDGAHNPYAIRAFVKTIEEHFGPEPIRLVFSALEDKDISGMMRVLAPVVKEVVVTGLRDRRVADPERLARLWRRWLGAERVSVAGDVKEALTLLKGSGLVFATGSLYLVGELLELAGASECKMKNAK